jgi:hypothetical protein
VFLRISSANEETLGFTRGRGVWVRQLSEAPCIAWKCGTRRSDRPIRVL